MKHLFATILLIVSISSQAQRADSLLARPILKVLPFHLFDLDNSLTLGMELPFKNSPYTIQTDIGYGQQSWNIWEAIKSPKDIVETWRLRVQWRYYFTKKLKRGYYVAMQYAFKKNTIREWESIGKDCVDNNCAYSENIITTKGRFASGLSMMSGWQWQGKTRWSFDLYLGLGFRTLNVKYLGSEQYNTSRLGGGFLDFGIYNRNIGSYGPYLDLFHGFYVGYAL